MKEATYNWRPDRIPTVGKDHLTLADWRMSVPSKHSILETPDSTNREAKRGVVEYEFSRPNGTTQKVVLESGAKTAFPISDDDAVLIALLTLNQLAGHPEVLKFEPSHVLALLRRPDNPFNVRKIKRAIERFQRMSSTFEGIWFSRKQKSVLPKYDTGIIAEAACLSKPGRRKKGERLSHVQWTKSFHESLSEGNLINVDLELLASWKRPGAMQLYRHLNKVWKGGRKPFSYERDLVELACGHLLMSRTKDTKRNLSAIIAEMEAKAYLAAMPGEERFYKSNGRWRVRLELHTDHRRNTATEPKPTAVSDRVVVSLVQEYHLQRFGTADYHPTSKEIACGERLLAKASLETLREVTSAVVAKVKKAQANDLYFGFAERFYEEAIRSQSEAVRGRRQRAHVVNDADRQAAELARERFAKHLRRKRLLDRWNHLTDGERSECVQRALERSSSQACRERISMSVATTPAPEVLNELDLVFGEPAATTRQTN